jgi:hypothetical protein
MTPETVEVYHVARRNDFIVQNHYVKKQETLLYNTHQNLHNKSITFLHKIFQILCDSMFFAFKKKVNSIPLS